MNNLHIIDIAVICLYLVVCLVIGLNKVSSVKDIRDYSLGTGNISTTVLLFTILATHIGAGSTIGTVEKLHSMGMIFAVSIIVCPLFWLLMAKIFANNIGVFKKAGCMSVSDIMGFLYGKPGKWVTNVLSIFLAVAVIAAQTSAIGYLFNYFLGVPRLYGVIIGFSVLVTYSLFGGIRAVTLTDTFQSIILLVAIPIACITALHEIGGYDVLLERLPATHTSITFTETNAILLASMVFYSLLPISSGTYVQRFLIANDEKQLSKALIAIAFISLPFTLIICLIGFVIKVKAPEIDPNTAFFYLIGHYLPAGITGLLITGILAAIMSTADSWLNTAGILCAHDIVKGLFPNITVKEELLIARISVLLISILAMLLAFSGPSLMGLLWFSSNFWEPVVLIPLIAGFLGMQTNQRSFVASTLLGILSTLFGKYITGEFATTSMLFGTIGSATGLFGMHYWQIATRQDTSNTKLLKYLPKDSTRVKRKYMNIFVKQATQYKDYANLLGGLGMIYFLGSSFFMAFTDMVVLYTVVYMKAAAAILCFGLCIYDFHLTPKQQKQYMPVYWNLTLLYCFPFLSAYIALIYNGGMPWMINLMLSMILLYVFGGWISVVFLSVMGFSTAYLLFKLTGYNLAVQLSDQPKMLGYIYCLLTGAIILILKQKDIFQEKELQAKMLYGAAIAHEVVNPLQGSAMMADTLISTYKDKEHPSQVSLEEFNNIKALLYPFKESSFAALKMVDRMLTLIRTDISQADDIGIYDIKDCVEDAVKMYSFNVDNLIRITIKKDNSFQFKGSRHFVSHVISNLISNTLKYAGPNSQIEIWFENQKLYFIDNGYGIDPDKMPFIFDAFDNNGNTKGTGVGLSFCKRVMESMGGSITCISHPNEGAKFVLSFGLNSYSSNSIDAAVKSE